MLALAQWREWETWPRPVTQLKWDALGWDVPMWAITPFLQSMKGCRGRSWVREYQASPRVRHLHPSPLSGSVSAHQWNDVVPGPAGSWVNPAIAEPSWHCTGRAVAPGGGPPGFYFGNVWGFISHLALLWSCLHPVSSLLSLTSVLVFLPASGVLPSSQS